MELRPASEVKPGEQIIHPITGAKLTAKMVTEFNPPPGAGIVGHPPQIKILVYEWPDEKFMIVSPHTEV